nr:MAG TPA: hypothetical protein [Caudoviricetes sp.]
MYLVYREYSFKVIEIILMKYALQWFVPGEYILLI